MKKRICGNPGCNELIESDTVPLERYCPKHKEQRRKEAEREGGNRKFFENAARSNGAFYNTRMWRDLRKEHLKNNSYCIRCGSKDNLQVDHIIAPRGNEELFFNADNLQTLCASCHSLKTNIEIRKRKHE